MPMLTLGTRLRLARLAKNITQRQAAEAIGMSVHSIRYYERDKVKPKLEIIEKLCIVYDYPPELLIPGSEYVEGRYWF